MSHLPLDTTYPLQLTIEGEIKGLQLEGYKLDQLLQGFYIRNSTGLTNSKPSWTHENSNIGFSIWFDDARESWVVGYTIEIGSSSGSRLLRSSTSPDSSIPQEAENWEYLDLNSAEWTMSGDISIKRGM